MVDKNEDIELAEEHIKLAEEIISKEAINSKGEKQELLKKGAFDLEKAEAEIEDSVKP